MNIEKEIFKKSVIEFDKLIPYGFKKEDEKYIFTKNILKKSFQVWIEILNDGTITGRIYDLAFNEEYTNYRIENSRGEFASKVRAKFENVLVDIKDNCTIANYFISDQANRITNLILEKYQDKPEFLWDRFPGYAVFRNPSNTKWYALIANINKSKLDKESGEVEILNIKLDENKVKQCLNRKGFYKAYHMNKENWITIILDETIKDNEIMQFIEESHKFTEVIDEWIVPANSKYYDVMNCFKDTDTILWKQSSNIKIGDIVYLYVAKPYSAIIYKCKVLEANIPYEYKDNNISMSKVMRIKLISEFDKDKFTFEKLQQYGIKAIRGPIRVPKSLSKVINNL